MWSAEESERLRLIMEQQKGLQKIEWTLVAQELGTGRTSAQVGTLNSRTLTRRLTRHRSAALVSRVEPRNTERRLENW